jgi:hypothetical protein
MISKRTSGRHSGIGEQTIYMALLGGDMYTSCTYQTTIYIIYKQERLSTAYIHREYTH